MAVTIYDSRLTNPDPIGFNQFAITQWLTPIFCIDMNCLRMCVQKTS